MLAEPSLPRPLLGLLALLAAPAGHGSGGEPATDAAVIDVTGAVIDVMGSGSDGCVPGCHWDCFGGTQCEQGTAWVNGFAPRECCQFSDPWPGPGPECAASAYHCQGGDTCVEPDPRYQACLRVLGTSTEPCFAADCEPLRLYCPEGAVKQPGAPCSSDGDCRPAAEGVARLRCDGASTTCVLDTRPLPPAGYGASCGLEPGDVPWLNGEALVAQGSCALCQVLRIGDGCLRQGCTQSCVFDEDCPAGSVCLCGTSGGPSLGYCAAASDRESPAGRGAGLADCR